MTIQFGTNMYNLRNERGMSINQFANDIRKKSGEPINKGMISRWERSLNYPSLKMLIVIAKYFNVSLDELVGCKDA